MGDGGCVACGIGDRYIGSGPSRSAVVVGVVAVVIGAVGGPFGAAVGSMRTWRVRWDAIVRGISATLETGHVRLVKGRGGGAPLRLRSQTQPMRGGAEQEHDQAARHVWVTRARDRERERGGEVCDHKEREDAVCVCTSHRCNRLLPVLQDKQERNKCVPCNLSVMLQEGTQDTDRM